ncbi:Thiol:disulfide interchange protein DsbD [Ferriphaselus amnicola]|uniref:Thiol:disulfide interchange protein DsbD n=1 Tax=Ferriphaselus amnicola TaxID=1188319 RepID=A0A2Z6G8C8_9PROT|nr:protein-disulfide reductase DsbD [Ferriphaselus amnicola]BBE49720.1 Thiol:disulfide interchange protein DsbD [Ferriphaselus amnicola]
MKLLKLFASLILLCAVNLAHAGVFDRIGGNKSATFLPPDQAFGLEVSSCDERTLLAGFRVTPGYYLYRNKVTFELADGNGKIVRTTLPPGEIKDDPNFGKIEVYHQSFQAKIELESVNLAQPLSLLATYQGCSENGLCYPPINKTVMVGLSQTVCAASAATVDEPANEDGRIAKVLQQGNFWLVISVFFGAGLLLAFTPCVFPMVPILSGIIVGHGHKITHRHAFFLSLAYVLGMALTYAAAGVAAGLSGELISNALQTPWVLGSFAALFVILSLSMFGLYELQLPSALQSRLTETSSHLHGGHFGGVFAMGALSAIIMSPCVAAPMAGALLYIGKTHDALLGGSALFALALGMGLPLLLIGTSAGALLPRAGAWMESVKRIFGVMMLGVAIWIVSPLFSISLQMGLWAALLILSAMFLRVLDALPPNASGWRKLWRGIGVLMLMLGAAYLVGALSGARDIFRPLGALGHTQADIPTSLPFERIKSLAELDARIANAQGKRVMLDFYADWCVSCKEMERFTFADPQVRAKLKDTVLLQADVTANNDDDKALLKRYTLFGPPASLFYDGQGKELGDFRVTGFQNAELFLRSLAAAGF